MTVKPGVQTTEFWMMLVRFVAGIALIFYEPTREIGLIMTGFSGSDGVQYMRSRTELKKGN